MLLFNKLSTTTALLLFGISAPQVQARHPDSRLFGAKTIEEYLAAKEHISQMEESKKARRLRRKTSEESFEVSQPILADSFGGVPGFYHGVASGDPLSDRVILWTRYTPVTSAESLYLELRLAEVDANIPFENHLNPEVNENIRLVKLEITAANDYIAKVDAVGLKSNTHYVYVFTDGIAASSEVGQTRTAPSMEDGSVEEMTYAFFSCSQFSFGYFHAYDVASTIENLDFWIHLGDYIYEYGVDSDYTDSVDNSPPERREKLFPKHELIELQDYRTRYATYHAHDEGLRNLRRRAPVIQIWDDHEFANDSYGTSEDGTFGAENHQENCTEEDKLETLCTRDEGDVTKRFDEAAQAWLEWMPIRRIPNSDITTITQVIEWGDLASIVALDTRLTSRSAEPTLSSYFEPFLLSTFSETNITAYYDESSEVRKGFEAISESVKTLASNPESTMIGEENKNLILDVFENSKSSGKSWQIFAAAVVMGPRIPFNFDKLSEYAPDFAAAGVKQFTDAVLVDPEAIILRTSVAMSVTKTPLFGDSFDGFSYEKEQLLNGFQEKANNAIVLAGDSHDSWGYTLYKDEGSIDAAPVAVNLGCTGVTSPGWSSVYASVLNPLSEAFGGALDVWKLATDAFNGGVPGLKYSEIYKKGFVAVKATKERHVAEYILFEPNTLLLDYADARNASAGLTAPYSCDASLSTTVGEPGSLNPNDACGIVTFESARHSFWDLQVPVSGFSNGIDSMVLSDCGYSACEFGKPKTKKAKKNKAPKTPKNVKKTKGLTPGNKRSKKKNPKK